MAILAGLILAAGAAWYLFSEQPVTVDLATVARGPLRLTVHDDGRTRIREKYTVSTPVGGRLIRIDLKPGDSVSAGETILSVIEPTDPALLDPRSLAEARARESAAEARLAQVEPRQLLAQERLKFAESELQRLRTLHGSQAVSQQEVDAAVLALDAAQSELAESNYAHEIAKFELRMTRAAMIHTGQQTGYSDSDSFRFPILAPISGKVLRVLQESATILPAGAPLLEIGDPNDLEIEVDVLSTDAVKIRLGASVYVEHWGGEQPLRGKVRLIEPSAFTKVSALGIEEQRVNVIIDFDRQQDLSVLGDGYRLEASVVVWEDDDVLKAPIGALFRSDSDWAVFVNAAGRAELRRVTIGKRNDLEAQILDGLSEGTQVIVHPGDQISSGARLKPRPPEGSTAGP
ncbi:MAG: HlyD family efflux transporter periplasmic adaptor subunit [Pirellulaceae bacterium]|nr:HlyD family efflux transporter periplasmic adaptor subunit [Pirellulaceae bacterium]